MKLLDLLNHLRTQNKLDGIILNLGMDTAGKTTLVITPMKFDDKGQPTITNLALNPNYLNVMEVDPNMVTTTCQAMGCKAPKMNTKKGK